MAADINCISSRSHDSQGHCEAIKQTADNTLTRLSNIVDHVKVDFERVANGLKIKSIYNHLVAGFHGRSGMLTGENMHVLTQAISHGDVYVNDKEVAEKGSAIAELYMSLLERVSTVV